jgi:hypothetical protein
MANRLGEPIYFVFTVFPSNFTILISSLNRLLMRCGAQREPIFLQRALISRKGIGSFRNSNKMSSFALSIHKYD